jgi:hypothetical protein
MAHRAVFEGLVVDEDDHPVGVRTIGGEPFYVVDDDGFLRHIPAETIDRQVLTTMQENVLSNREAVVAGMLEYMGKDDLFTKAAVEASIGQMGEQMEQLFATGLPSEARQWLGMMGLRIVIDVHGEVIDMEMPEGIEPDDV